MPTLLLRHRTSIGSRVWVAAAWLTVICWTACAPTAAGAATVYRCTDANNHPAFQDTPCADRTQQQAIQALPQPWIGGHARRVTQRSPVTRSRRHTRPRRRHKHATVASSWECRAANGEVFYRHTRCPPSVAGDGVVRSAYAQRRTPSRSRHNAWSRVRVKGKKIPRAAACQRIHAASAIGRDGHLRDTTVSTYDHLMGRDPCAAH